jgi:hypothetical protein
VEFDAGFRFNVGVGVVGGGRRRVTPPPPLCLCLSLPGTDFRLSPNPQLGGALLLSGAVKSTLSEPDFSFVFTTSRLHGFPGFVPCRRRLSCRE